MRQMTLSLLAASTVALAACTPAASRLQTVREVGPEAVVGCTELGTVTGVPKLFGPFANIGLNDARNAAKRAARAQGATDVVFDPIPEGETIVRITGRAYRCGDDVAAAPLST